MLGWRSGLVLALLLTIDFRAYGQTIFRPSGLSSGPAKATVGDVPVPKEEPKIPPETPLSAPSVTKEQIENPPARELKVVKVAEPLKRGLRDPLTVTRGFQVVASTNPLQREFHDPDPKLTEHKWAAIVRIKIPGTWVSGFDFDSPLRDVADLGGQQFLHQVSLHEQGRTTGRWFSRLLLELPEGKLAKAEEEFIRSWQADRGFVQVSEEFAAKDGELLAIPEPMTPTLVTSHSKETYVKEFRFVGATEEECERRARMLITLLDEGFSKTLQGELLRRREANAEAVIEGQQEYLKTQAALVRDKKQLAGIPAEDTDDLLPGMRVQLRMIDIELAANQAKLAALEKALSPTAKELSVERRKLAEDAQFLAQIDRTALEVKRQKSAEVIANAETRKRLAKEVDWAERNLPQLIHHIDTYRKYVADFDRDLLAHGPVTIVGNRIAIRPVEWRTRK